MKPGQKVFWGGYSGYFEDPDGRPIRLYVGKVDYPPDPGTWAQKRFREEEKIIEVMGIDHVAFWVADLERSKHFYMNTLGMELESEDDTSIFLKTGPTHRIGLFLRQDGKEIGFENETHHVGLTVHEGETYGHLLGELHSKGLAVWDRPGNPEDLYFIDPDGHDLQIHIKGSVMSNRQMES